MKHLTATPPVLSGTAVCLKDLHRSYADKKVLDGLNLEIAPGEILALLGPSGCGKTTLLKILAGLEQPSSGEVWMGESCVANARSFMPPEQRGLGMVFQDYALWPHLNVQGNVAFPLRMRRFGKADIAQRVAQALAMVGLQGMGERSVSSLSGGQQQRVALARAMVAQPKLILFDEPLSNLDRDLRESLCTEIRALLRKLGCTAVYVTHDHEEACTLADRVAVVMNGRFHQLATPQTLWSRPATPEVANFLKLGTLLDARWSAPYWQIGDLQWCAPPSLAPAALPMTPGNGQILLPHGALQLGGSHDPEHAVLHGHVVEQHYRCGQFETWVETGWQTPLRVASQERLDVGARIPLSVDLTRLHWFAKPA